MELHVQQGDTGAHPGLHLGHEHHRAAVAAAAGDEHLAIDRDATLGAEQVGVALDPAGHVARQPTPVDDADDGVGGGVALDGVAGEAHHCGDGRVEVGEHLHRAIADAFARHAGREHLLHQRPVEHTLVAAADAHRDGLRLMFDGIDGTCEFFDGAGERRREVVDEQTGRGDRASGTLVGLERRVAGQIAQEADEAHRRAGLEMPVVQAGAQAVEEAIGVRTHAGPHLAHDVVGIGTVRQCVLDDLAGLAQRPGRGVDGDRCLVAEQMTHHRRQHERQRRIERRNAEHRRGCREPLVALGGHNEGRRLVGLVDGHFLGHIVGGAAHQSGGAHQDERLARQVDVLLVLGDVAGDRLVAELAQLDAYLLRRHRVGTVADDGPVPLRRSEPTSRLGDAVAGGDDLDHRRRHRAQRTEQFVTTAIGAHTGGLGDGARQQHTGRHLGVEGLGGRDTHLHVAAVTGVHHAVGFVGEVAVAAVHDGQHRCATRPHQVDSAVGVGRGAALADGDDERVAHVELHAEPAELGGGDRVDVERPCGQQIEHIGHAATRHGSGALADDAYLGDRAISQPRRDVGGQCLGAHRCVQLTTALDDLAAERLAETLGRFADLFQQEVRCLAPVDVACGDLRHHHLAFGDGQRRAVVGEALHTGQLASVCGVEHEHLAATARRRRSLAIDAQVAGGLFHDAVGLAGNDEAVVGEADVQGLAAAAQGEIQLLGFRCRSCADCNAALERCHRAAERLGEVAAHVGRVARHERRDDLGVGGDGAGDAQAVLDLQVGVVVDVAVQRRHRVALLLATGLLEFLAVQRVAVRLADDADAGPTGVTQHRHPGAGVGERQTQQRVGPDGIAQRPRVVAQFADLGGSFVDEAQAPVGQAYRTALEQRVGGACSDRCRHGRVVGRQTVVPDEQVQTGRVAAAHFESVDGRQRLLHRQIPRHRSGPGVASREVVDGVHGAQTVAADRPDRIAQCDEVGTGAFDVVGRHRLGTFEHRLGGAHPVVETVETGGDSSDEFAPAQQGLHTGYSVQQCIALGGDAGHLAHFVGTECCIEQPQQGGGVGHRPGRRTTRDRDDAAHICQVIDPA